MSDAGTITYATQRRVIAAGVESAFDVTAAYVACISASHTDFDARFNDGAAAIFAPGLHVGGGGVPKTQKVSIRNTHATDSLIIEIAYGIGQFFDRRLALPGDAVKVQPTAGNPPFMVQERVPDDAAEAQETITAGGDGTIIAADPARVRGHLTNHGAGTVYVRASAGGGIGRPVAPGETFEVRTQSALYVHNPQTYSCLVTLLTERFA